MAPKKKSNKLPSSGAGRKKQDVKGTGSAAKTATKVDISSNNEARLRRLLLNVGTSIEEILEPGTVSVSSEKATKALKATYDALLREGFRRAQIEIVLRTLPQAALSLESALDWLCLNLPADELPLKFSRGIRTAAQVSGGIQVLATARPDAPSRREAEVVLPEEAEALQPLQKPSDHTLPQRVAEDKGKGEQAAWIRRYMDQQEEDSEEDESEKDDEDDWEVWADPRERERRKASRRAAALDPAVREAQIAEEYAAAKAEAGKAKGAGDKARQQAAGKIIWELKEEMTRLGINEEQLLLRSSPRPQNDQGTSAARDEDGNGAEEVHAAEDEDWEALAIPSTEEPAEAPLDFSPLSGTEIESRESDAGPIASSDQGADDIPASNAKGTPQLPAKSTPPDEEEGMSSMFDEDSSEAGLPESVTLMQRQAQMEEPLLAWGTDPGTGKSQLPGGKKKGPPKGGGDVQRQPKALLQQHCQKQGWPPPRFEKLPAGGGRIETGGYRYSVTVERPGRGKGKRGSAGPLQAQLPADEDGWPSIAEAQNAAATFALYELARDQPLYRILPVPYSDMWKGWELQGSGKRVEAAEFEERQRSDFIDSLVSEKAASAPSRTAQNGRHEPEEESTSSQEEGDDWSQLEGSEQSAAQQRVGERLKAEVQARWRTAEYRKMLKGRLGLPIARVRDEILGALRQHDVVVVSGETGSGKTTQVPQYILDAEIEAGRGGACSVVCTQPRRIAAVSVAERVTNERCEPAPGENGALVGYHVRLDAARSSQTRLLFCTTGILLRRLAGDRSLADVSHVVVDEVHERTLQGDFLMTILKELVARRNGARSRLPPLKVVLMSATLDAGLFSRYFNDCPVVTAEGRTFPVETHCLEDVYEQLGYRLASDSAAALREGMGMRFNQASRSKMLGGNQDKNKLIKAGWGDEIKAGGEDQVLNPNFDEKLYEAYSNATKKNLARLDEEQIDYDLLEDLITYIDESGEEFGEGAVLVFLPGLAEIQNLLDRLLASRRFGTPEKLQWLLPLHSSVSPNEQRRAFQNPPPGVRKIVVATNIAETSITIPDVVVVVDSGRQKEQRYDAKRGMASLVEAWVSQANARQRAGRAGRVRPGTCFTLYTRRRLESQMRPFQAPEMARVPLAELCLQVKLLKLGTAGEVLAKAIEPPKEESVAAAVESLREVGALDEKEELTPLGHHLAALPVDARIGKIMIYGAIFGCLSPALTIAACLSYKSPFFTPSDQRDAAEQALLGLAAPALRGERPGIASGQQSDHLAMVAAYEGWKKAVGGGGAPGKRAGREHCRKHFLNQQTLEMLTDMRAQFATLLADIGFVADSAESGSSGGRRRNAAQLADDVSRPWNAHGSHPAVIKAVLCAGLYPHVAAMDKDSLAAGHGLAGSGKRPRWTDGHVEVAIHPSSVNHMVTEFKRPFLVFHEKVRTTRVFVRDCTVVSPYALLLFGGAITVLHQEGRIVVDGWLEMNAPAQTAVLFKELQKKLDALLIEKINRKQISSTSNTKELMETLARLLIDEDKPTL